jgi:uncharacterized protein (DUF1810 family)
MEDPFDLHRFVIQQVDILDHALAEIRSGEKRTHWMWFIFPQLRGLGHSPASQYYGIGSLDEARAYLDHPMLGQNLRRATEALTLWSSRKTAEQILGPIDALKLCSSMTLFDRIEPAGLFAEALDSFFGGRRDERSLALLNGRE